MLTKGLAALVVLIIAARVFVSRDSELARRYRLFVNLSLILLGLLYGGRLLQLWLA